MTPCSGRSLLVAVCSMACVGVTSALEISEVRPSRTVFDPAKGESVEIRFRITEPASVELRIYDGRDVLTARIPSADLLPEGTHILTWTGETTTGSPAPPEAYRYVLAAESDAGTPQRHDLSDLTGDEAVQVDDVSWDAESGNIRYRLSAAARVNIRVGLQDNGPLLATVVDWVPRPAGYNEEPWDGRDASRVLDLREHPRLSFSVNAHSLSANTLFVTPWPRSVRFFGPDDDGRIRREPSTRSSHRRSHFAQQPLAERGDLEIQLVLPADLPVGDDGVPLASGIVPVRLDVAPELRRQVLERRFEPMFFVDGLFAFENEVGYLPFTWLWDTTASNEGIHYISANLLGYAGNFGMATVKVRVRHEPDSVTSP